MTVDLHHVHRQVLLVHKLLTASRALKTEKEPWTSGSEPDRWLGVQPAVTLWGICPVCETRWTRSSCLVLKLEEHVEQVWNHSRGFLSVKTADTSIQHFPFTHQSSGAVPTLMEHQVILPEVPLPTLEASKRSLPRVPPTESTHQWWLIHRKWRQVKLYLLWTLR